MSVSTEQEFLDRLKASISSLPLQDQADILNDYEEHFRIGMENGKTEAEIADSLGSPEELGASFVEENARPTPVQEDIFFHSQPSSQAPEQTASAPGSSQSAEVPEDQPFTQSQADRQAQPFQQPPTAQEERAQSFQHTQSAQQSQSAQWAQEAYSPESSQQPPYPPNAGDSAPSPYNPNGSEENSSVRTGPLVAMILLTVFIIAPVFFGVIIGVSLGLVCLCFALILVSFVLFSFTPFHLGFAMLGLAFIFLSLLVLCGLIGFIYGMVKAIIAYTRCFTRVIRGKEAQV